MAKFRLSVNRGLLGDYGGQVLIWLATSAVFPAAVFYGYVAGGDTAHQQIGRGQLLLVAAALTAPIVGSLISIPGTRTFGRSLLFFAAFVHISVTIFYFASVADGTRSAHSIVSNSLWLYLYAVIIGVCSVLITARAIDRDAERRIREAHRKSPL
jgi:hypothetical protein